jgi:phosphate transporter
MGRHGRRYTAGCVALAVITGVVLVSAPLGFGTEEFKGQQPAQRCLGLVGVVVILWSTEAIAPFVTSMLIPLLAIPSRVLCVPRHIHDAAETDTLLIPASYCNATNPAPGAPMEAEQAVAVATGAFFDPMILLFLSGFVMSEVLVRRGISERCAGALLSRAGTGPRQILGATMLACVCTSAITSNVPASVLGTSLLKPTFGRPARRTEAGVGSTWDIVSLLGVAFACNVGGMTSPIASPQNVVALIALERATQGEVHSCPPILSHPPLHVAPVFLRAVYTWFGQYACRLNSAVGSCIATTTSCTNSFIQNAHTCDHRCRFLCLF